ncbi:hypothetical protein ACN38_g1267 [Penicillium nordicum]|uniref:Uncharacterized protein n=1 Tax=Penicillium nordicum TaxID=229535 RepID=A0A0M8PFR8_9EURO|nr:hypothetical protein ACN38_g1267 [Penicillium nordicum]
MMSDWNASFGTKFVRDGQQLPPMHTHIQFCVSLNVISDPHLEMLTQIRVHASFRAEARQRVFEQASFIMETLEDIIGQPYPHQLPIGTLLQDLEQRMRELVEEMGALCIEEEQAIHISNLIWGETGEPQES